MAQLSHEKRPVIWIKKPLLIRYVRTNAHADRRKKFIFIARLTNRGISPKESKPTSLRWPLTMVTHRRTRGQTAGPVIHLPTDHFRQTTKWYWCGQGIRWRTDHHRRPAWEQQQVSRAGTRGERAHSAGAPAGHASSAHHSYKVHRPCPFPWKRKSKTPQCLLPRRYFPRSPFNLVISNAICVQKYSTIHIVGYANRSRRSEGRLD